MMSIAGEYNDKGFIDYASMSDSDLMDAFSVSADQIPKGSSILKVDEAPPAIKHRDIVVAGTARHISSMVSLSGNKFF